MQTKFKSHQRVKLLINPDPEYIEYHTENPDNNESFLQQPIKKGMMGKINLILPNGTYHVEVLDNENKTLAYVVVSEESLEPI